MAAKKALSAKKTEQTILPEPQWTSYRLFLWLAVGVNSVFFIWQCLDRYLAPRFLCLSVVLLGALILLWRDLIRNGDRRFHLFDGVIAVWYAWNLASISWAFERSEAIFYSQKVLLFWVSYYLIRETLFRQEAVMRRTLWQISCALVWVVGLILVVQIGMAWKENGLDNNTLYAYASGVSGNKGLVSDFLFFLAVLQVMFYREATAKWIVWANLSLLIVLILLLQTRTVYLASMAVFVLYATGRAISDAAFRQRALRWLLVGIVVGMGVIILVVWKGKGTSIAERLNPATYLESTSAGERIFVWYKTDQLFADHFWAGVGNGSWKIWLPSKSIAGAYRLQEKNIVFTRAHNDFLEIRAELGLIGATIYVLLFLWAAGALIWAARRKEADHHLIWCVAAGLFGYWVIQFFDFPRERIEMQVILALLLAWSTHIRPIVLPGSQPTWVRGGLFAIWGGLLVFNIVVGWYRIQGEIHNVRLLKVVAANNNQMMLTEAKRTRNPFYQYNDVVIPIWWYDGVALYRLKKNAEAIVAFEQAYRLNPWSFQVLNNYGTALSTAGEYDKAIPIFEAALQINPKYDEGKFNLAYIYDQIGNLEKAYEWTMRADTIPNPTAQDEIEKNRRTNATKSNYLAILKAKMEAKMPPK